MKNKVLLIVFSALLNFIASSQEEALIKIEEKYGPQWDFCTCVVAMDSIQVAFMKDGLTDEEFDAIIERSDVVDLRCKKFLSQDSNNTPEERKQHEWKVRKCLRDAEIKE